MPSWPSGTLRSKVCAKRNRARPWYYNHKQDEVASSILAEGFVLFCYVCDPTNIFSASVRRFGSRMA